MPEYQKQGSGPAFLYVSGIEGTGKNFYKQAEDLARDHTVISFPLRPEGRYRMEALVEDLAQVMRDSGFERATVLGESFGGLLVLAAALENPNLFERMILVNSFAAFPHRAKINLGVALYSVLPYSLLKAYRTKTAPRTLFSDDVVEEDRLAFREHTRHVRPEGYLARLRIIRETDLRPRLPEIKVPALVVAGTEDRLLNAVAAARVMADGLARARLLLLNGTGHMALLSSRVRVRDWLGEFDRF
ncbi:MAG TPA: alpha/beta fold hydrolase [Pyrinomonadaceae bacterium]|nr:alpha/beta fold hydrolase [Pyrinomonadaceae bacterium]